MASTFDGFAQIDEKDKTKQKKDGTVFTQVHKGGYSSKSFYQYWKNLLNCTIRKVLLLASRG